MSSSAPGDTEIWIGEISLCGASDFFRGEKVTKTPLGSHAQFHCAIRLAQTHFYGRARYRTLQKPTQRGKKTGLSSHLRPLPLCSDQIGSRLRFSVALTAQHPRGAAPGAPNRNKQSEIFPCTRGQSPRQGMQGPLPDFSAPVDRSMHDRGGEKEVLRNHGFLSGTLVTLRPQAKSPAAGAAEFLHSAFFILPSYPFPPKK